MINKGKIYDRNVDGDYEIKDTGRIENIYLRKSTEFIENRIYPYATIEDLRIDLIERTKRMAILNYSIKSNQPNAEHQWANMTPEEILRSMKLYDIDYTTGKQGLTLAAILLFGKDETILSVLSYHRTDAIFRVKNLDRYDDRDDIRTNLIESYDRLMAFADKHLDDRFYLEGDQRKDLRNLIAREICTNLLIHRDFSNPFPAKFIIEKDRIRTENANKPKRVGKIDINTFTPYPKNPKIASVFREMGLVDELGSGVRNLYKYTPIYSDGANPEFIENDIFETIVPLEDLERTTQSTTQSATQSATQSTTQSATQSTTQVKLNATQKKILNLLKEKPELTRDEMANILDITVDGVKYNLNILKNKGIIKGVDGTYKGHWEFL